MFRALSRRPVPKDDLGTNQEEPPTKRRPHGGGGHGNDGGQPIPLMGEEGNARALTEPVRPEQPSQDEKSRSTADIGGPRRDEEGDISTASGSTGTPQNTVAPMRRRAHHNGPRKNRTGESRVKSSGAAIVQRSGAQLRAGGRKRSLSALEKESDDPGDLQEAEESRPGESTIEQDPKCEMAPANHSGAHDPVEQPDPNSWEDCIDPLSRPGSPGPGPIGVPSFDMTSLYQEPEEYQFEDIRMDWFFGRWQFMTDCRQQVLASAMEDLRSEASALRAEIDELRAQRAASRSASKRQAPPERQ